MLLRECKTFAHLTVKKSAANSNFQAQCNEIKIYPFQKRVSFDLKKNL